MRPIDADALIGKLRKWGVPSDAWVIDEIKQAQTIDAEPVIHCKDCKHRPIRVLDDNREGFNIEFPTERCPCQCDDPWFNWMPDDDWYCANAERKTE